MQIRVEIVLLEPGMSWKQLNRNVGNVFKNSMQTTFHKQKLDFYYYEVML